MKPSEGSDAATLLDMLGTCADIIGHTQGIGFEQFLADRRRMQAAAYAVAVLGEAVKRLSIEFREKQPNIPWKRIAGMRDRLIHGYDTVEWKLLWAAIGTVPALQEQLQKIADDLGISPLSF